MPTVTINETAAMKPAFQAPHEALHYGQVNYQDFGNEPALKLASDTLGAVFEGQRALNELRQTPSPLHTPAQHAKLVKERVDASSRDAANKLESAKQMLRSKERQLESELASSANLKPIEFQFSAITGSFQALTASQKTAALDGLIEEIDGPTLAALIAAPSYVTGLAREQRGNLKSRIYAKVNPEAVRLREQVSKALQKLEAASLAHIAGVQALLADTDRFANQTARAELVAGRAGFAS